MNNDTKSNDQFLMVIFAVISSLLIAIMVYFLIKHPISILGSANSTNTAINLALIIWSAAILIYWAVRISSQQGANRVNNQANISLITSKKRIMPWHLKLRLIAAVLIWIILLGWVIFFEILPAISAVMKGEI